MAAGWSRTEDQIMRSAVMKYGTNQWNRVASLLARKNAAQCKARWTEHLDPRIAKREWSPEEDHRLLALQSKMPNMWRSIGATLGGRTGQQCYERWQYLLAGTQEAGDSEGELDAETEKHMLAEAKARLANSMGRKAKRKQRERLEAEHKFRESIETHRKTGAPIKLNMKSNLSIPKSGRVSQQVPLTGPIESGETWQPRRPDRPALELPPARAAYSAEESWRNWQQRHPQLAAKISELIDNLPAPTK